jgi:hypothetical protein
MLSQLLSACCVLGVVPILRQQRGFKQWSSRWKGRDIPLSYIMGCIMYVVLFISSLKLSKILEIQNYFKFFMKTLKTQNTNIVHHENIHNISFVTNIKFFLYFAFVNFNTSISQLWMN